MLVELNRRGEQDLAEGATTRNAWLRAAEVALVDLDVATEAITTRAHHHRAVPVQHRPRRLVRTELHLAL